MYKKKIKITKGRNIHFCLTAIPKFAVVIASMPHVMAMKADIKTKLYFFLNAAFLFLLLLNPYKNKQDNIIKKLLSIDERRAPAECASNGNGLNK